MLRLIVFVLAALCILSAGIMSAVHADVDSPAGGEPLSPIPTTILMQGRLTDSFGSPLPAGPKTFTFRIFSNPAGPTQVWPAAGGEVQMITTGADGLWAGLVGAISPLTHPVFSDTLGWLEIDVDGTSLPRVRLNSAPYAFRVATVDGSLGGKITTKVSIGPGHTNTGSQTFVAGSNNSATGGIATIGGGSSNLASGNWSTIVGGSNDTASGQYSVAGGGRRNVAAGVLSFAAGFRARALHDGTFVWADSTNADIASTAPNQFVIRAAGGVGIGTNAPEGPLHIFDGSAGTVTANSSSSAVFERNNASYISILSPDASERGILLGSPSNAVMGSIRFNPATTPKGFHFRAGTSSIRLILDSLGNLTADGCIVGSNIACPSDARFKRNIETIPNALGMVGKLRGVKYEWEREKFADRDFPAGQQVGLIAQEVREVVPQAVIEQSDGYLAVDYARLVPLLIESIKAQQKQIDELTARLDSPTP